MTRLIVLFTLIFQRMTGQMNFVTLTSFNDLILFWNNLYLHKKVFVHEFLDILMFYSLLYFIISLYTRFPIRSGHCHVYNSYALQTIERVNTHTYIHTRFLTFAFFLKVHHSQFWSLCLVFITRFWWHKIPDFVGSVVRSQKPFE